MQVARKIVLGLAWLYVLGVVIQFFLAGLGTLGGEEMTAHKDFGWMPLHLYPIVMFVVALIGRLPRNLLIASFVLAVIVFVQPLWVTEFRGEILGALHVVGALIIFYLAHWFAIRLSRLNRGDRDGASALA